MVTVSDSLHVIVCKEGLRAYPTQLRIDTSVLQLGQCVNTREFGVEMSS